MRNLFFKAATAALMTLVIATPLPAHSLAKQPATAPDMPPQIHPQKLNRVLKQAARLVPCSVGHAYQLYWRGVIVVNPTADECLFKVDLFGICVTVEGCL